MSVGGDQPRVCGRTGGVPVPRSRRREQRSADDREGGSGVDTPSSGAPSRERALAVGLAAALVAQSAGRERGRRAQVGKGATPGRCGEPGTMTDRRGCVSPYGRSFSDGGGCGSHGSPSQSSFLSARFRLPQTRTVRAQRREGATLAADRKDGSSSTRVPPWTAALPPRSPLRPARVGAPPPGYSAGRAPAPPASRLTSSVRPPPPRQRRQ